MTSEQLRFQLRQLANPETSRLLQRYFKTGPGQYGEGDRFLGIKVPPLRALARQGFTLAHEEVQELLASEFHEERLLALLIWVGQYARQPDRRQQIVLDYLGNTRWVNNWDLVDQSAPGLLGKWLLERGEATVDLQALARSTWLWDRRIAVLATLTLIRANSFEMTLRLTRQLMDDGHDLMNKACGWMLRELGKRNPELLREFLLAEVHHMPRTMLRYAIERLPEPERRSWLKHPSALKAARL